MKANIKPCTSSQVPRHILTPLEHDPPHRLVLPMVHSSKRPELALIRVADRRVEALATLYRWTTSCHHRLQVCRLKSLYIEPQLHRRMPHPPTPLRRLDRHLPLPCACHTAALPTQWLDRQLYCRRLILVQVHDLLELYLPQLIRHIAEKLLHCRRHHLNVASAWEQRHILHSVVTQVPCDCTIPCATPDMCLPLLLARTDQRVHHFR